MPPRVGRRRAFVPWILLSALLVLIALAAFVGSSADRPGTPSNETGPRVEGLITGFGGYRWHGIVNEIGAQWVVPKVIGTGGNAAEATWIGAQGTSRDEPFIQLGTMAYRSSWPSPGSEAAPGQPSKAAYIVFWSDTAVRFRAIPIVRLSRPGDLISFRMAKGPEGWSLRVKNLTVGWSRSVSVRYGQNDSFSQGEWLQEDPAARLSSPGDVPYATTSSVEVRRLRVNGRNPRLRYRDGQALSTADGLNLTPTPVKHDEFSLVEASGFARQYLSDAESFDVAATRLQEKLSTANGQATQAQIQLVNQLAILFGAADRKFESQTWPRAVRPHVEDLARTQLRMERVLSDWVHAPNHSIVRLRQIMKSSSPNSAADRVRRSLGIPPI
jgi:hypothetical protein